jgi:hypothetical protein
MMLRQSVGGGNGKSVVSTKGDGQRQRQERCAEGIIMTCGRWRRCVCVSNSVSVGPLPGSLPELFSVLLH